MSLTTILSEIWRFIKDSFIKIIVGALLISAIAVLGSLFLPNLMGHPSGEVVDEERPTQNTLDEDTEKSREYLKNIYEQDPAEFEFYAQLEDGNTFGNSFIFDEYFTSLTIVEEIESETGVEYGKTLSHEDNLGFYKTSQYRGSIAAIRNTSSNVITIRVQAGESKEDNLKLAEAFANKIFNNEIPFVEDLSVTSISEPKIGEQLVENDLQMVSSLESLGMFAPAKSNSRSILLYGIAGFIMGIFLTTTLLFVIQMFKSKINYAFQYSWDFDDHHFIFTTSKDTDQLTNFLLVPEATNQLLVYQESNFVDNIITNNKQIKHTSALSRGTKNNTELDEIVLLIESKVTDKEWYNEQYRLAEMYGSQVTIVQVMNGKIG